MKERILNKLNNLEKALLRLNEAIIQPMDSHKFMLEATMQCFEFSYELTWKTLKACLELEGIQADTPKNVFQEAYKVNWILDEKIWLQMLKDRNTTSHVYNEKIALVIYENIKKYYQEMRNVFEKLKSKTH